ncbi:hypothetical protein ACFQ68_33975 [Amycolatopsis japonica]|uniref:hypothetical protein n=1 Tax=Amycolatopsis japonica TaxID=208439 RepID=UPI003671B7D7
MAKLSGGLIDADGVRDVWRVFEYRQGAVWQKGELKKFRLAVRGWRRVAGGPGTLRALFEQHEKQKGGLPPGIFLNERKKGDNSELTGGTGLLFRAWLEGLYGEGYTHDAIEDLSGKLFDRSMVAIVWNPHVRQRRFEALAARPRKWTKEQLKDFQMDVRNFWPRENGPKTVQALLEQYETEKGLPWDIDLGSGKKSGQKHHRSKSLLLLSDAWAEGLYGEVTRTEDVAKKAGNVITATKVDTVWKRFKERSARQLGETRLLEQQEGDGSVPSSLEGEVPDDVVEYGVAWPLDLLEYLKVLPGYSSSDFLESTAEQQPTHLALTWARAWAAWLFYENEAAGGELYTYTKVADKSGKLLTYEQVLHLWNGLRVGKSLEALKVGNSGILKERKRAYDDARRAEKVNVGVMIGKGDEELRRAVGWLPEEPGVFGVVLLDHGMRDAEVIARAIRASGWQEGQAVRLFACETDGGVVARLASAVKAKLNGAAVGYPTAGVWLGIRRPGVAVMVGAISEDGKPLLVDGAADGFGWIWLIEPTDEYPYDRIEGLLYLEKMSEDAPAYLDLAEPRHLGPARPGLSPTQGIDANRVRPWEEFIEWPSEDEADETAQPSKKSKIEEAQQPVAPPSGDGLSLGEPAELASGMEEPRQGQWPDDKWDEFWENALKWRPVPGEGPQTFWAYLEKQSLPPYVLFAWKEDRPVWASASAELLVRMWAEGLYGDFTSKQVAEKSGGLIDDDGVEDVWKVFEQQRKLEESPPVVARRPEEAWNDEQSIDFWNWVVSWRPDLGVGPQTFWELLQELILPDYIHFNLVRKVKDGPLLPVWASASAELLVRMWVEGMYEEGLTAENVAKRSGGLIDVVGVEQVWSIFDYRQGRVWQKGELKKFRLAVWSWRQVEGGPDTLRKLWKGIEKGKGGLPKRIRLKAEKGEKGGPRTSTDEAVLLIQAWVEGLYGKNYGGPDIVKLSGELIGRNQIIAAWRNLADQRRLEALAARQREWSKERREWTKDQLKAFRMKVRKHRGPDTLRKLLKQFDDYKGFPGDIWFGSGKDSTQKHQNSYSLMVLSNAWAEVLYEEVGNAVKVAKMSDDVIAHSTVSKLWKPFTERRERQLMKERLEPQDDDGGEAPSLEGDVPNEVVTYGASQPQDLWSYLQGRSDYDPASAKRWARAWAAWLYYENKRAPKKLYSQQHVADKSGKFNLFDVGDLWRGLGAGKSLTELGVGNSGILKERKREHDLRKAGLVSSQPPPPVKEVAVGVMIGKGNPALMRAVKSLPKESGVFGVVLLDHDLRDPEVIERAIRASGWEEGQAVRLYACETDGGVARLASALHERLNGASVGYPTAGVWLGMLRRGLAVMVGAISKDGKPLLVDGAAEGAGWIWLVTPAEEYPHDRIEGLRYLENIPEEAKDYLGLKGPQHLGPVEGLFGQTLTYGSSSMGEVMRLGEQTGVQEGVWPGLSSAGSGDSEQGPSSGFGFRPDGRPVVEDRPSKRLRTEGGELGQDEVSGTQASGAVVPQQGQRPDDEWDEFWDDALKWRRVPGGPQTFWAYLEKQSLPPYILFAWKKDRPVWASASAELLVRMWAEGLYGDFTAEQVVEMSGVLIDVDGVEDAWKEFKQQEILTDSPPVVAKRLDRPWTDVELDQFWDKAVSWRPEEEGQTFWNFLKDQPLPEYILFKINKKANRPMWASGSAELLVRMWVEGLYNEGYGRQDVARISGGLINARGVRTVWQVFEPNQGKIWSKSELKAFRLRVRGWRRGADGVNTLRALFDKIEEENRGLPPRITVRSRAGEVENANSVDTGLLIRAWLEGLYGKKYGKSDIAGLADDLFDERTVFRAWSHLADQRRLEALAARTREWTKEQLKEFRHEVRKFRLRDNGPSTLRELLEQVDKRKGLPGDIYFGSDKESGQEHNASRGLVVLRGAWVEGLYGLGVERKEVVRMSGKVVLGHEVTELRKPFKERSERAVPEDVVTYEASDAQNLRKYVEERKGNPEEDFRLKPTKEAIKNGAAKSTSTPLALSWFRAWAAWLFYKNEDVRGELYTVPMVIKKSGELLDRDLVRPLWHGLRARTSSLEELKVGYSEILVERKRVYDAAYEVGFEEVAVGVMIGKGSSELMGAVRLLPEESGVFGVVLLEHGMRDADVIVQAMRLSGWREGQAVRLFGCEVAGGVMARLASAVRGRLNGVPVGYPGGAVWLGVRVRGIAVPGVGVRGIAVLVGGISRDGKPLLEPAAYYGYGWIWLIDPTEGHPDGRIDPGLYRGEVPDDAPELLGLTEPQHLGPDAPSGAGERMRLSVGTKRPGQPLASTENVRRRIDGGGRSVSGEQGGLYGTQVSSVVTPLQGRMYGDEWDDFWEKAPSWRRGSDGPRTFWEFLAGQPLPPYVVFEVEGDRRVWASASAELLVRMWVEGMYGEGLTAENVAERSGGLIDVRGVDDVWGVFEEQEIRKVSPAVVAKRKKVWTDEDLGRFWENAPSWRPDEQRPVEPREPQLFSFFLLNQPLPDCIRFKWKDGRPTWASASAELLVRMWVEGLYGVEGVTAENVAEMSGGLIDADGVKVVWSVFANKWGVFISGQEKACDKNELRELQLAVLSWRRAEGGKDTLRKPFQQFKEEKGGLPYNIRLKKEKGKDGSRQSTGDAVLLIHAWAEGFLGGADSQRDIVGLSGDLIDVHSLNERWNHLAAQSRREVQASRMWTEGNWTWTGDQWTWTEEHWTWTGDRLTRIEEPWTWTKERLKDFRIKFRRFRPGDDDLSTLQKLLERIDKEVGLPEDIWFGSGKGSAQTHARSHSLVVLGGAWAEALYGKVARITTAARMSGDVLLRERISDVWRPLKDRHERQLVKERLEQQQGDDSATSSHDVPNDVVTFEAGDHQDLRRYLNRDGIREPDVLLSSARAWAAWLFYKNADAEKRLYTQEGVVARSGELLGLKQVRALWRGLSAGQSLTALKVGNSEILKERKKKYDERKAGSVPQPGPGVSVEGADVGVLIGGDGHPALKAAMRKLPREKNDAFDEVFGVGVLDHGMFDAEAIEKAIRENGWQGQPVRLLMCAPGDGEEARRLAWALHERLGVMVGFPAGWVWVGVRTPGVLVQVGGIDDHGGPMLDSGSAAGEYWFWVGSQGMALNLIKYEMEEDQDPDEEPAKYPLGLSEAQHLGPDRPELPHVQGTDPVSWGSNEQGPSGVGFGSGGRPVVASLGELAREADSATRVEPWQGLIAWPAEGEPVAGGGAAALAHRAKRHGVGEPGAAPPSKQRRIEAPPSGDVRPLAEPTGTQASGSAGQRPDDQWDEFWENALKWRPVPGEGPQTFWEYLAGQVLPPYIVFEVKGDQPAWASASAELLVRMWVEGLHGEKGATRENVAEMSGGLIDVDGVDDVWKVFGQQETLTGSKPVVARREAQWTVDDLKKFWEMALSWRPDEDSSITFWDFLQEQYLPDCILFALEGEAGSRRPVWASESAELLVRMWVEDLHGEGFASEKVAHMSGGLIDAAGVEEVWRVLYYPKATGWDKGERKKFRLAVLSWRPEEGRAGTLKKLLFEKIEEKGGELPRGILHENWARGGKSNSRSAALLFAAWAEGLHGKGYNQQGIENLSEKLIGRSTVGNVWKHLADQRRLEASAAQWRTWTKEQLKKFRMTVRKFRPGDSGVDTLQELLEQKRLKEGLPGDIRLGWDEKSGQKQHRSHSLLILSHAWVEALYGEVSKVEDVAKQSGKVVPAPRVSEVWKPFRKRSKRQPSSLVEEVSNDVVTYGADQSLDLLGYLKNQPNDPKLGFLLKSLEGNQATSLGMSWARAWAAWLFYENEAAGRELYTYTRVADKSGRLLSYEQVLHLWNGLRVGKSLEALKVGNSGILKERKRAYDDARKAEKVAVGVMIGKGDEVLRRAVGWLPKESGVFGVVLLDHDLRDPEVIERAIRASGWEEGQPVRLYACETDGGVARLASALHERLNGASVGYPTAGVWLGMLRRGLAVMVGAISKDGKPLLVDGAAEGAGWIWLVTPAEEYPHDRIEGLRYLENIPEEALESLGLTEPRHLGPALPLADGRARSSQDLVSWPSSDDEADGTAPDGEEPSPHGVKRSRDEAVGKYFESGDESPLFPQKYSRTVEGSDEGVSGGQADELDLDDSATMSGSWERWIDWQSDEEDGETVVGEEGQSVAPLTQDEPPIDVTNEFDAFAEAWLIAVRTGELGPVLGGNGSVLEQGGELGLDVVPGTPDSNTEGGQSSDVEMSDPAPELAGDGGRAPQQEVRSEFTWEWLRAEVMIWRPVGDETLRDLLADLHEQRPLPRGSGLRPDEKYGLSREARDLINDWARGLRGECSARHVEKISGKLITNPSVGRLWKALEDQEKLKSSGAVVLSGEVWAESDWEWLRAEVMIWRPVGNETLRDFLAELHKQRPLLHGSGLRPDEKSGLSREARDLIYDWVKGLKGEYEPRDVEKISGRLITYRTVVKLWKPGEDQGNPKESGEAVLSNEVWTADELRAQVLEWIPGEYRTLRELFAALRAQRPLPDDIVLKPEDNSDRKLASSPAAVELINAWAVRWYEAGTSAVKIDDMSGSLITAFQVGLAVKASGGVQRMSRRKERAEAIEVPQEVLDWRPGQDEHKTLRDFLQMFGLPAGFKLKSGNNTRSNLYAKVWIRAWVYAVIREAEAREESLSDVAIRRDSGDLIELNEIAEIRKDIRREKREAARLEAGVSAGQMEAVETGRAEVWDDVVWWRPPLKEEGGSESGESSPLDVGELPPGDLWAFLDTLDLPEDVELKSRTRKGAQSNKLALKWIRAWLAGLYYESVASGKPLDPREAFKLSGGLYAVQAIKLLWEGLEQKKKLTDLNIGDSESLAQAKKRHDARSGDIDGLVSNTVAEETFHRQWVPGVRNPSLWGILGLPVRPFSVEPANAGVLIGDGRSDVAQAMRWLPKEKAFGVGLLDHGMNDLDLIEGAVRNSGWQAGQPIRLFVCETGDVAQVEARATDVAQLARDLRARLGVEVGYPRGWVWLGVREPGVAVQIGAITPDGRPMLLPGAGEGEGWIWLGRATEQNPQGVYEDYLKYEKYAPKEKPTLGLAESRHLGPSSTSPGVVESADLAEESDRLDEYFELAEWKAVIRLGFDDGSGMEGNEALPGPSSEVGQGASTVLAPVPEKVLNWPLGDGDNATLADLFDSMRERGELPHAATGWIHAWVAAQRGKGLSQVKVAAMSGGLIDNEKVGLLWRALDGGESFAKLGIPYYAAQQAGPGVLIGHGDPDLRRAAGLLPKEEGKFGVVLLDHWMRDLDVIERAVRDSGWQAGEPIRLFAHKAGDDLRKLAIGLHKRLGVPVGYPAGTLWLGVRGPGVAVQVSGVTEDGKPYLPDDSGYGWIWQVTPTLDNRQGLIHEARYSLSVPPTAQARLGLGKPRHLGPRIAGIPAKVLNWRPGDGGRDTLLEFLEDMSELGELPEGFSFKKAVGPRRSIDSGSAWINAWAVRLYTGTKTASGEPILTYDDVVRMSGGLIENSGFRLLLKAVKDGKRSFVELGIAEPDEPVDAASENWLDVPDDVVNWSPGDGDTQTLYDYLIKYHLRSAFVFRVGKEHSNRPAQRWIRAWVAAQLVKDLKVERVSAMSGGLLDPVRVRALWRELRGGKSFAELGIPYNAAQPAKANVGVVIGYGNPGLKEAAKWLPKEEYDSSGALVSDVFSDLFDDSFSDVFGAVLLDHWMHDLDVVEWAVRGSGWQEGQPIRLYAYGTDDSLKKLAIGLRARLGGVPVGYPADRLWLGVGGDGIAVQIGDIGRDGRPILPPGAHEGEGWIWLGPATEHNPRGMYEDYKYKMPAPREMPTLGLVEPKHLGPGVGGGSRSAAGKRKRAGEGERPQGRTKRSRAELVAVPDKVLNWRPGDGRKYTLKAFLEAMRQGDEFVPEDVSGWVNAWAERLYNGTKDASGNLILAQADVIRLSGDLIVDQVKFSRLLKSVADGKSFAELGIAEPHGEVEPARNIWLDVPYDVVNCSPGDDVETLYEHLNRNNYHMVFAFGAESRSYSSEAARRWIRAWVAAQHGKGLKSKEVAALSGGLINSKNVKLLWQGLDDGKTFAELGIAYCAAQPAKLGVLVGNGDPVLRRAAGLVSKEDEAFGALLLDHGARDLDVIEKAVRDSEEWQEGQPVRLFTCETGDAAAVESLTTEVALLAKGLQARLGVWVGYPTGLAWLGVRPGVAVQIGGIGWDGRPILRSGADEGEGWIWLGPITEQNPRGVYEDYKYETYAPLDEPMLGLAESRHLGPGDTDPAAFGRAKASGRLRRRSAGGKRFIAWE